MNSLFLFIYSLLINTNIGVIGEILSGRGTFLGQLSVGMVWLSVDVLMLYVILLDPIWVKPHLFTHIFSCLYCLNPPTIFVVPTACIHVFFWHVALYITSNLIESLLQDLELKFSAVL
ncbi:hypothetical protein ACJX0J_012305, partial [Zea mays]